MDVQIGSLLPVLILLVLLSAFFSASETAYASLNKMRLMKLVESGDKKAEKICRLLDDMDRLHATLLIGKTFSNSLFAVLATGLFMTHWEKTALALSVIFVGTVSLLFAEVFPKTIAKELPETLALAFVWPLRLLFVLFYPLTLLLAAIKKVLSWLLPKQSVQPSITEEELLTLVEEAAQEGSIDEEDEILIKNVVEFNDLEVQDIYTPRPEIVSINAKKSLDEISTLFQSSGRSRLPYYEQTIDEVLGVVYQKDFYHDVLIGGTSLAKIVKPVLFIHQTMRISELMKKFQLEQSHLAIVVDEYGGTEGLVTLEDIVEELVGEIWDEYDDKETDVHQLNAHQYLIQGSAEFDVLEELFDLTNSTNSTTLGGYIMSTLGHIPVVGEKVTLEGLELEIKTMDEHRVDQVLVTVTERPANQSESAGLHDFSDLATNAEKD